MASKIFKELQKKVKPENRQFIDKNLAISRQVRYILNNHPTIKTQKDLAKALGKEPSEISKWLNGLHNIGLESITKMETVLGYDIILTDEQAKEKYGATEIMPYKVFESINISGQSEIYIPHEELAILPVKLIRHSAQKRKQIHKKDSLDTIY